MSFVAPALRWPDTLATHLPQPLKDTGIPPQYFVIVPATLLAVLLTYTLTQASSVANAPHLASTSSDVDFTQKRSHGRSSTVVLVGLSETGKTSLFASLVYGTTPSTLPSQKLSQGLITSSLEASKPVTLIDLPGHPRLRPLVDEHLSQADGLVICIDAVMASKSSTSSRPGVDGESITDVADLLHSTLTVLAKQRSRSSSLAPPSVLVLFTRADLSPLLGGSSVGTDAAKDEKRRAQLLSRCRTTLESELGQRRANMGLGRRRGGAGVKIAGLGKVADAEVATAGGMFEWVKRALGLTSTTSTAPAQEEDEEEEDEVVDYIDWAASQRATEDGVGAGSFSFDRLDDHVVWGGKVDFALATVGKNRSWDQTEKVDTSGLTDFTRWIDELQQ
ncbi:Signal recognition particle receptor, beta subunit [Kalmanozyma brasiliensis GHG001]|uniref:Signal recognition particle receptor subunit beta n=1 Tax=Kalmanozyma brasiliensis (strain GHG001) TaxID=1365824 RepID=V5ESP4_KALBG|nr:Signal recognition particle receptor, beta subunit [Kalmanozyma brasiliensis GHG001]EST08195.1 Signal recognition particle receptor, beta subunit [Kalmanozyma brasiliensis GHG001]